MEVTLILRQQFKTQTPAIAVIVFSGHTGRSGRHYICLKIMPLGLYVISLTNTLFLQMFWFITGVSNFHKDL